MSPVIASGRKRPQHPAFISTWKTNNTSTGSSNANQITLPLYQDGIYDFKVDWGDGTSSHITSNTLEEATHDYAISGTYTLTIKGTLVGFRFNNVGDCLKLLEVHQWGCLRIGNYGFNFMGCSNLILNQVADVINIKGVDNLQYMFCYCTSLNVINRINEWDMSNVTTIRGLFFQVSQFNQPLNNWDTSNITDMSNLFYQATSFNQPLNNWNIGKVTTLESTFYTASAFNQPLNNWDTSNVTSMLQTFGRATSFNQPLNNWNTSKVTDMRNMFRLASGLNGRFNQDISSWDTGKVTTMFYMFAYNTIFNQPLDTWDVSSVFELSSMFRQCKSFNQQLNTWITSKTTDMDLMFLEAQNFNQPLSNWNTENVTTMEFMFQSAPAFNQDISNWNIQKVSGFTNFMALKTFANYSTANYDALLNSWSTQNVITGRTIHFGTIKYTSATQNARNILINSKGWTIYDGGMVV
ncbi:BspA family leucine-rich repeat surface protein [Flavobacterium sp. Sd200]|uniref:BspA family leucine-rich repeat surface protein n=1 Tax=Flavobacterium sp. Sd200 TaxID=2692211 RepID=UPI00136CF832|nr:BspA family leucine-rich repeat surface protein [Flavobacterium sp. Sd200]MXN91305.1 BspA family leucine-rich repeat surface protein [Flavobacterium sp. Sd200]